MQSSPPRRRSRRDGRSGIYERWDSAALGPRNDDGEIGANRPEHVVVTRPHRFACDQLGLGFRMLQRANKRPYHARRRRAGAAV
jgi:hypothetical protein